MKKEKNSEMHYAPLYKHVTIALKTRTKPTHTTKRNIAVCFVGLWGMQDADIVMGTTC